MNYREIAACLELEGWGLAVDETTSSVECPKCRQSGSFSLTRREDRLLYICHRASCGVAGAIPMALGRTERAYRADLPPRPSPYEGQLRVRVVLPLRVSDVIYEDYGIEMPTLRRWGCAWLPLFETSVHKGRLWIPWYNMYGETVGGTARSLERDVPKNISRKDDPLASGMAWYEAPGDTLIVVEDPFSAMRVWQAGGSAVALNGTSLTEGRVLELNRAGVSSIVLALDGDAIQLALTYHYKYATILPLSVKYLPKDVKDMSVEELDEWLGSV